MAIEKVNFVKAITALKKQEAEKHKKVNFNQTVDLIINLKDYDLKKNALNLVIDVPNKIKENKVAGFLEKKTSILDAIIKQEFESYSDKGKLKKLIKEYDFFIASAKLMPSVATTFGRVLGPAGKMPSPQIGILFKEDPESIKKVLERIDSVVRVRTKEPSIKVSIGKQSSEDNALAENAEVVYNNVIKNLANGKDNVRTVLVKYTMSKPIKVEEDNVKRKETN